MLAAPRRSRRRYPRRAGPDRCISAARKPGHIALSPSVRYVLMPPVFSTARLMRGRAGPHRYRAVAPETGAGASPLRRDPYHRCVFLLYPDGGAVRARPQNPGGQLDPHQHPRIRAYHGGQAAAALARHRPRLSRRVRLPPYPELDRFVSGAPSRKTSRLRDGGGRLVCRRSRGWAMRAATIRS